MYYIKELCRILKNFTFQSGSIQISTYDLLPSEFITLHSNLVLFKCEERYGHGRQCFFTFQSGSIQIALRFLCSSSIQPLHSNLVLFKCSMVIREEADIDTLHSNLVLFKFALERSQYKASFLYIPIWFYSNGFVLQVM